MWLLEKWELVSNWAHFSPVLPFSLLCRCNLCFLFTVFWDTEQESLRNKTGITKINKINKNRMCTLWQIIHGFLQILIGSSPFSVVVFLLQPVWCHDASMTFDVRSDMIPSLFYSRLKYLFSFSLFCEL